MLLSQVTQITSCSTSAGFQFVVTGGWHSALSGVLASIVFVAIVFVLTNDPPTEHHRRDWGPSLRILFVTFFVFLVASFLWATVAGFPATSSDRGTDTAIAVAVQPVLAVPAAWLLSIGAALLFFAISWLVSAYADQRDLSSGVSTTAVTCFRLIAWLTAVEVWIADRDGHPLVGRSRMVVRPDRCCRGRRDLGAVPLRRSHRRSALLEGRPRPPGARRAQRRSRLHRRSGGADGRVLRRHHGSTRGVGPAGGQLVRAGAAVVGSDRSRSARWHCSSPRSRSWPAPSPAHPRSRPTEMGRLTTRRVVDHPIWMAIGRGDVEVVRDSHRGVARPDPVAGIRVLAAR